MTVKNTAELKKTRLYMMPFWRVTSPIKNTSLLLSSFLGSSSFLRSSPKIVNFCHTENCRTKNFRCYQAMLHLLSKYVKVSEPEKMSQSEVKWRWQDRHTQKDRQTYRHTYLDIMTTSGLRAVAVIIFQGNINLLAGNCWKISNIKKILGILSHKFLIQIFLVNTVSNRWGGGA